MNVKKGKREIDYASRDSFITIRRCHFYGVYNSYSKHSKIKKEILPCFGNVLTVVEALRPIWSSSIISWRSRASLLLGMPVKDLDIEVHGIALEQLEVILKRFGNVRIVGKQFGVLRIDGIDVDWSIPRIDGAGRKPIVQLNPYLSLHDAFLRET
ncbi:MAG: hypothetical protein LVQ75_00495 [Candidatus Babeliales bacterium]